MNLEGRTINNRYRLHERVRRDSLGDTYRAVDFEAGEVSFTIFNDPAASRRNEDIIRFKSDVKRLLGKKAPNIAAPREIISLLGYTCLVSDPCEGLAMAELFRSGTRLDFPSLIALALDIARGLGFIHDSGVPVLELHPENIIVTDAGAKIINAGSVHLRDYGPGTDRTAVMDRMEYLSPEQTGMVNRTADIRSDLFSLGAIIYRLSSGVPPFRGDDICSTLYCVIAGEPDFTKILDATPPAFSEIMQKLLQKEPDLRYQGAGGLIKDLEALVEGESSFEPGRFDDFSTPSFQGALVGREAETEKMKSLYDRAVSGHGVLCLLRGEAGAGKTRLVEELLRYVYTQGGFSLYGKCSEGYETVPYGAAGELLGSFMQIYRSLSGKELRSLKAHFTRKITGPGSILTKLNPALGEVFSEKTTAGADEKSEFVAFHDTAAAFFIAAAQFRGGLVAALDDIQWSDEGSLAVIGDLLTRIARRPVMVLLTSREEMETGMARLAAFRERAKSAGITVEEVHAAPLDLPGTARLIAGFLRDNGEGMSAPAEFIYGRAAGNIFHTISLLRRLTGDGILRRNGKTWEFDLPIVGNLDVPGSLLETVLQRLMLLDKEQTRLLSLAAALGREFSLTRLFSLTNLEADRVVMTIDRALVLQILKPYLGERNTYEFFHDRIREILYDTLDMEERKTVHLAIAKTLEKAGADSVPEYEFARHYLLGGNDDAFLARAIPAARQARENFAYDDAEKMLAKVLELTEARKDSRWDQAIEELARIHLITGDFAKTAEACSEILPRARDSEHRAGLLALRSEAFYRLNEYSKCLKDALDGLQILGEQFPEKLPAIIIRATVQSIAFLARLPWQNKPRPGKTIKSRDRMIIALYRTLIENYMFMDLGPEFVFSSLRMAVIAQYRIGPSKELSTGLIGVGMIFAGLSFFKTALNLMDRAMRISLASGDRWSEAYVHGFRGLINEFRGKYEEGIDRHYRLAMNTFTEIGDIKNVGIVHIALVQSYYFLSDYERALAHNDESHRTAKKIDDAYFYGMTLIYYARLHREKGNLNKAEKYCEEAIAFNRDKSLIQHHCVALMEKGCLLLERHDPGGAAAILEEACVMVDKSIFSPQHVIHCYAYLAEAYLAEFIARERSMTRRERARMARKVLRAARKAERKALRWPSHIGRACWVRGAVFATLVKNRAAEKYFRRAVEFCRNRGNRYELARACYDFGLFLVQAGRERESRECIETAYELFTLIGSVHNTETCARFLGIAETGDRETIGTAILRERDSTLKEIRLSFNAAHPGLQDVEKTIERIFDFLGAAEGYLYACATGDEDPVLVFSRPRHTPDKPYPYLEVVRTAIISRPEPLNYGNLSHNNGKTPKEDGIFCMPLGPAEKPAGVCCLRDPRFVNKIPGDNLNNIGEILAHALLLLARKTGPGDSTPPINGESPALTDASREKLNKAIMFIKENYRSDISRDGLAAHLGMSPNYFSKLFREYTGQKMNEYITDLRIAHALELLEHSDEKIIDIAYSSGFDNLRTFNRAFLKKVGVPPHNHRKNIK